MTIANKFINFTFEIVLVPNFSPNQKSEYFKVLGRMLFGLKAHRHHTKNQISQLVRVADQEKNVFGYL
jgi:hypothetical protein